MSYYNLPFSAQFVLKSCHFFTEAVLFWAGGQALAGRSVPSLSLGVFPAQKVVCWKPKELQAWVDNFESGAKGLQQALVPSPENESNGGLWAGLRAGWAGFWGYQATEAVPLAVLFEFPFTISLDLEQDKCWVNNPRALDEAQVLAFIERVTQHIDTFVAGGYKPPLHKMNAASATPWSPAWSKEQYQQAFERVMGYLQAGDCYQVNLAMPFSSSADLTACSPQPLLQSFNPSFGGYFKSAELTLYSVSPERFMRVADDKLETRPIKGTVARGSNAEEDAKNKTWLANSKKNQAENLMIVDLLRNDLSLHAQPFSVKVDKLFDIETHANVHHLVSTISALKQPNISAVQAVYAAFPGGSITGAPKKRAMEIIAELEAGPRGAYCGSLGFIDDSGMADFNILIRTIVALPQGAQCWAGGGLVMDSSCDEEWAELHTKVARILREF